jgi:predicted TPR repeat methyltransferase
LLQTAGLLAQRLQAWKHAVGYLEEYMEAVEKIHRAQAKEYERVLKVRPSSHSGEGTVLTLVADHLQAP